MRTARARAVRVRQARISCSSRKYFTRGPPIVKGKGLLSIHEIFSAHVTTTLVKGHSCNMRRFTDLLMLGKELADVFARV